MYFKKLVFALKLTRKDQLYSKNILEKYIFTLRTFFFITDPAFSTRQTMKRTSNDASDVDGNKNIKIEVPPLNPMVFYPGFPHIAEKIFDQLDKGSLRSCREVSKSLLYR